MKNKEKRGSRRGGARIKGWYAVFNSPVGKLGLATTGKGICQIVFNAVDPVFRSALQQRWGRVPEQRLDKFRLVISRLKKYFEGTSARFNVRVDFGDATPFEKKVWQATVKIPYGQTRTYREIARATGTPRAYRAVGRALAKNPVPIIVPCHRVVGSDGSLVGFGGGVQLKKRLLDIEMCDEAVGDKRKSGRQQCRPEY